MTFDLELTLSDLAFLQEEWQIGGIADPLGQLANYIITTIENAIAPIVRPIINAAQDVLSGLMHALQSGVDYVKANVPSILSAVDGVKNFISQTISNFSNAITNSFRVISSSIVATISQVANSVSSGFSSVLSSLNSSFSNLVSSIGTQVRGIVSSISNILSSTFSQLTATISTAFSSLSSSIGRTISGVVTALSAVGSQIIAGLQSGFASVSSILTPAFQALQDFIGKQFGDLVHFLNSLHLPQLPTLPTLADIRNFIVSLKLPTLTDIRGLIDDLKKLLNFDAFKNELKKEIQDTLKTFIPQQILDFVKAATSFITQLTERHSPSILDNIGSFFEFLVGLLSSGGALGTLFESKAWSDLTKGKLPLQTIQADTNFFKPLTDYLSSIWTTIQQDSKPIVDGITKLFSDAIQGALTVSGLPAPDPSVTNPFGMIQSSITKEFDVIAKALTPSSPVSDKQVQSVLPLIGGVIALTEGLEFGALAIEALHPTKKLQFMDKLKASFTKIGLGHITEIIGASLAAASLSPFFRRYFNRLAQVQLVGVNELNTMRHRKLINAEEEDLFLQEHGYNEQFRKALITIGDELPSRFLIRSLAAVGTLTEDQMEDLFSQSGLLEKYVKDAANSTILQGQLPFIRLQATAFAAQVKQGFETGTTFRELLKKIGYPDTFMTPTIAAAEIQADGELNALQVSEYDKQYTEGYMTQEDYKKNITPLFRNPAILKTHITIADLAVQRMTDSRIRSASDRSISEELSAFATGAVSEKEFESICKAAKKTPDEIAALEEARQIIYANFVRTVKFRNYQSALGKGNIMPEQFEALCTALPIDQRIMKATEQRIILSMVKAKKLTSDEANSLLAQANIALTVAGA